MALLDADTLLQGYDLAKLRIGTIASHSALDLCDGATDEGFKTLAVCERGRQNTYLRYPNIVHETIILERFADVVSAGVIGKLRARNVFFVPNRSLTAYVPIDDVEKKLTLPMFGNRRMLTTDQREKQYQMFEMGKIPHPPRITSPEKIDRLVIVKVPDARNPIERAFFTCSSPEEYHAKVERRIREGLLTSEDAADPWIEEFVMGAQFNFNFFFSPLKDRLEFLGLDRRIQTNIDGFLRLPAEDQLNARVSLKNEEVGHESVTIRESLLEFVFEIGESLVSISKRMYPPGIIGPFALQGAVKPLKKIEIFDFSPRMPGSPVLYSSPYAKYLFGKTMTAGRRVAMETRQAVVEKRMPEITT